MVQNMEQNLKGISETLLIPLWARAVETKRSDSIIKDDKAVEMMDRIEYDFSKFEGRRMPQVSIAIRTEILDNAVNTFTRKYPDAVIINLGCGLDTRFFRVDNGRIRWYDLDLAEPIRIRRHFFQETERYKMIERSVFDYSWIDEIDRDDKTVLIIVEGLLMYFKEEEVKSLINKLVDVFGPAEMFLEVTTPTVVERNKKHDTNFQRYAPFQWGIKSGKEIEKINPRIKLVAEWNYFDYHKDRRKEAKITLGREFSSRIVDLRVD